ncbi:MAG: 50S ribosomal protein L24 [Deltaproteobacteria bacterium]|nr:50S ribosomal protein L24 [Deltaproteobacteria bacterium]
MKSKRQKEPATKKKLHIKKNDNVQVIAGKNKGATGKVLRVDRFNERIVVEGVNIITKHVKPSQQGQEGRIDRYEGPIHYSNVLLYCKKSNRGERIRIQLNKDGSKTRVFTKSGVPVE